MGSNRRLDGGTSATRFIEDLGKRQRNRSSAEAGDDAGDHLAQRIEMISAFQGHGESAPAEAGREGRAPGHEFHITRGGQNEDRKSTRLNSSHRCISYAVFCLKKKKN